MKACLLLLSLALATSDLVSHKVQQSEEEILAYWTPERMAAAKPYEIVISPEDFAFNLTTIQEGPETIWEGHFPTSGNFSDEPILKGAPTRVTSPSSSPYNVVGKVFFTLSGSNYVCSASQVNSNTVLTAGHCMVDKGTWATNWQFQAAYPGGTRKTGRYLYSTTTWINSGNFAQDWGFVTFGSTAQFTSWSGVRASSSVTASSVFGALGYPAAAPFTGEQMYQVVSNAEVPQTIAATGTVEMENEMTGGCSGGPWWWGGVTSSPSANGVNSFKYTSQPRYMYSPYFDAAFTKQYNDVIAAQLKA